MKYCGDQFCCVLQKLQCQARCLAWSKCLVNLHECVLVKKNSYNRMKRSIRSQVACWARSCRKTECDPCREQRPSSSLSLSLFQRIIVKIVGHSVWSVSAGKQTFANLRSLKVHPYWAPEVPQSILSRWGVPWGRKPLFLTTTPMQLFFWAQHLFPPVEDSQLAVGC